MRKGIGRAQQLRGHKRRAKVIRHNNRLTENKLYIVKLMKKYKSDFNMDKLKGRLAPGEVYISRVLAGDDEKVSQ